MPEPTGVAQIDVSRHARLYGHVWRATRALYVIAAAVFVPLYYVTVMESDFYATRSALAAQPLLVVVFILMWLATASIRPAVSIPDWLTLLVFAAIGCEVVARIFSSQDLIRAWHESFQRNDPNLGPILELVGPRGSTALFLIVTVHLPPCCSLERFRARCCEF